MDFSVLMSVYLKDNPIYLREALESVVNQTIMPSEIVLVKDGVLTEELNQLINRYTKEYTNLFNIISLESNMGLGIAMKIGVENCKFDIIARMDSDDISKLNRFEKQLEVLMKNENIALVGTNALEFIDNKDVITKKRVFPEGENEIKQFSKRRCPFIHPTIMFRKQSILSVGNYKDLLWFEDYYLFLRVINSGMKTINLQEELLLIRSNEDSFKRRGGIRYLLKEYSALRTFKKEGYYNNYIYITNILIRSIVRLVPNSTRSFLYNSLLRKNN